MKVGDLVKMKYEMWWKLRSRKDYSDQVGIVIERAYTAIKVMESSGKIRTSLVENYEVIS